MRARFKASNLNSQSCHHRASLHKSLINAISFKLEWFIRLAISIKGLAKLECLALRVIGSRIRICACALSILPLSFLQATAYIFTDMQTSDRHRHAHECYNVTAKRCGALLQWINQVCSVNDYEWTLFIFSKNQSDKPELSAILNAVKIVAR